MFVFRFYHHGTARREEEILKNRLEFEKATAEKYAPPIYPNMKVGIVHK